VNKNPVDPLNTRTAIVDSAGYPLPLFLRLWSELRTFIADLQARTIEAGVGLTGGGKLDADRVLSIEPTGVAAGTYKGSSTTTLQLTVNERGQITAIAEVPI
jgi:hypothetical protein